MAEGHDHRDRPATGDEGGETGTGGEDETGTEREDGTGSDDENKNARPQAELRWVQLREPRHAIEIGRNGRVLDSFYHDEYDAWEVLLETYEEET